MRTILHVGAHKTGTSLIQKYFRDKLTMIGDSSIGYVSRSDTNRLIGWGQHLLENPDRLRSRLAEELRSHEKVFVSHENTMGHPFVDGRPGLYPHTAELAKALAAIAEPFDAGIAFYVRPLADFVESFYLQTIQQGATHTFGEWWATIDAKQLWWTPVIEALDDAFGADRVIVGDFQEIAAGQNEFLRSFLVRCELPAPSMVNYRPIRNASISVRGLELALKINPYLENKDQRRAARDFLQAHFSNRTGERARPMPDDVRALLSAQNAPEYERLAARIR